MKDKTGKEKQALEDLDRILKGRESEVKEPMDDDTRTALEFAHKMAALREKPSKEFTANLKAELAHQLAEQEKKKSSQNQSFLFWEISRRRMWQGTVAALIVLIVTALILAITFLLNRAH